MFELCICPRERSRCGCVRDASVGVCVRDCAGQAGSRTTPSTAVHRPITVADRAGKKNEIFVDVLERLTVLFNSNVQYPPAAAALCVRVHVVIRRAVVPAGLHLELRD